jgi:hypothetical protein
MHVGAEFWQKVHYNAVFGDGKNKKKLLTQRKSRENRDDTFLFGGSV